MPTRRPLTDNLIIAALALALLAVAFINKTFGRIDD